MITGVAVATLSVGGAYAQTASAPASTDTGATSVQEFVVTGSRIPSPNLTSVSPVTTVNSQEVKLEGTTNVEDLINNLPQAFADYGGYESNGASGTATVDLRGLGNVRTLVLIDGKRVQPGDPTLPVADLNFIPPALIDRVEILTGGASAVYGSDAVAGVVNFIMKKNFEGLSIDVETSIAEHDNNDAQIRAADAFGQSAIGFPPVNFPKGATWDGQRHTVTITGGVNSPDGKGNVEFYLGYTSIDPVLESKRDYSSCALSTDNTANSLQYCSGSTTDATGRLAIESGPNAGNEYDILLPPTTANGKPVLQPFSIGQAYNFAPLNYLQRPDTRYTAGEFSTYEVSKAVNLYSSFMFMDDHTVAQIAGSGSFFGDNIYTIPCSDPLLSVAQVNSICGGSGDSSEQVAIGRRNIEGGGRTSDIEHMDYRIVFGSKGDIGQGWTYDVSMQYGRSLLTDTEGGYFLNSHLLNALDVVSVNGVAQCASGPPCVPYNLWSNGGVTPAALSYLEGTSISSGATTEQVVTGSVAGDLGQYGIKSPFATDGVGISFGAEYRREYLETQFDATAESGDLAGAGGSSLPTSGSQSDKDVFGELRVPLIQNVTLIKDLTFESGYRYSDYTSGGGNNTYKFALDWQTIPDVRLRASYERAVRAPNVQELFDPLTPGLVAGSDPCAGANPTYSAAQCYNTLGTARSSITEAQFASTIYGKIPQCISGQCGDFSGGNPNLVPEVADTKSIGIVFTPTFIKGFSFSLDYFNIVVNKAIVTLPFNLILQGCAVDDSPASCSLIQRNAALGYALYGGNGAGYVSLTDVNAASLATRGFDINSTYRMPLDMIGLKDLGSLGFNLTGTYVSRLTTTNPGEASYNCAGLYGLTCGTPTPKWRHEFRTTWMTPWNVSVSVNWRYLSPTNLDCDTTQVSLAGCELEPLDTNVADKHIPAFSYFDLAFTWKVKDRYTFRGGVNNIFDRTPPVLDSDNYAISSPPFGNGNTYPQVFDPLGRVMFLGVTADF